MLERYVSEELIGAAYSPSWGGLTQNPVIKSAVTLALAAVNPDRVPTSFIQGDTIGYSRDFDGNMAVLVNDLMMMKMTDLRYRLGGAPIAVPVTEVERIPTWQEVATVQTVSRKCEDYLPMMEPYVDWGKDRGAARRAGGGRQALLPERARCDGRDGRRRAGSRTGPAAAQSGSGPRLARRCSVPVSATMATCAAASRSWRPIWSARP